MKSRILAQLLMLDPDRMGARTDLVRQREAADRAFGDVRGIEDRALRGAGVLVDQEGDQIAFLFA